MFDLADFFIFFFTLDALLDATTNAFVFPPGIDPGIFNLLGECVDCYTVEPLNLLHTAIQAIIQETVNHFVSLTP